MANEAAIELEVDDGIATLVLNRPQVRNALDDAMRGLLIDALEEVSADGSVKALVLTGRGKAFCAGGDIRAMQQRAQAPAGDIAYEPLIDGILDRLADHLERHVDCDALWTLSERRPG